MPHGASEDDPSVAYIESASPADLALILAAPALLAALEEIRTGLQMWGENYGDIGGRIVGMMAMADVAIAKATGDEHA